MRVLRGKPYIFVFKYCKGNLWVKSPKGGIVRLSYDAHYLFESDLCQKLFVIRSMTDHEMFKQYSENEAVIDISKDEAIIIQKNKI